LWITDIETGAVLRGQNLTKVNTKQKGTRGMKIVKMLLIALLLCGCLQVEDIDKKGAYRKTGMPCDGTITMVEDAIFIVTEGGVARLYCKGETYEVEAKGSVYPEDVQVLLIKEIAELKEKVAELERKE
jgi:hypothetical protein